MTNASPRIARRALLAAALATPALAQTSWPTRAARIIVPQPPGGALDILIRAVSEGLRGELGQPFVVENRPGGNSVIGLEACATAAPDGTTFAAVNIEVMTTMPTAEPELYARFASIEPVTQIASAPAALVASPEVPVKDLREFVAWARGRRGLNYGSSGVGSSQQIVFECIKARENLDLEHVPFRGLADAIRETMANRVQATHSALAPLMPHILARRLQPLVVLGTAAHPDLPGTPSMADLGYDLPYGGPWWGLAAPPGTPAPIKVRLAAAVRAVVTNAEFRARVLGPQFFDGIGSTPAEFAAVIQRERIAGADLLRLAGIVPGR